MILMPLAETNAGGWLLVPVIGLIVALAVSAALLAAATAVRFVGLRPRDSLIGPTVVTALSIWWFVQLLVPIDDGASALPVVAVAVVAVAVVAFGAAAVQRAFNDRMGPEPRLSRIVTLGTVIGITAGIGVAMAANDNRILGPLVVAGGSLGAAGGVLLARAGR